MLVKDAMTVGAQTVTADETVQIAAQKMKNRSVGALPVVEGDRVVGVITDRDITVRACAAGRDPKVATVAEAMTPQVFWCFEDQDTGEAARIMEERAVRRILVLDREEQLVGMLSVDDLALVNETGLAAEILDRATALRPPAG
jgi:CBS domain-containing protein